MLPGSNKPILFFDGVCNLCNSFVQFIIRYDKKKQFRFSSLQSGTGQTVLRHIQQQDGSVPDSVILLYKGKYYTRSSAALKVAGLMGGIWNIFAAGYVLPAFVRDRIYDWVATNRYKWFGKKDECMIPTPELRGRFID